MDTIKKKQERWQNIINKAISLGLEFETYFLYDAILRNAKLMVEKACENYREVEVEYIEDGGFYKIQWSDGMGYTLKRTYSIESGLRPITALDSNAHVVKIYPIIK